MDAPAVWLPTRACVCRYGDDAQQSGVMAVAQALVSSTVEAGDMIKCVRACVCTHVDVDVWLHLGC